MRYGIVAFSLFGLAIASTGCSRDAVDVDFSADAGRAIRFEGRCDDATRAVPGDPADGKVPVYWCDGDAVSVVCAQATPSVGRYVLTCPDEFSVSASFGSGIRSSGAKVCTISTPFRLRTLPILKYRETVP